MSTLDKVKDVTMDKLGVEESKVTKDAHLWMTLEPIP